MSFRSLKKYARIAVLTIVALGSCDAFSPRIPRRAFIPSKLMTQNKQPSKSSSLFGDSGRGGASDRAQEGSSSSSKTAEDSKVAAKPPPPGVQAFNELIHQEPWSIIAHGAFWSLFFFIGFPLAGATLSILTLARLLLYITGYSQRTIDTEGKKLAIMITGCDSGFGWELVQSLASKGDVYHIFAGCLKESSFDLYKGYDNVTPIKVDVTNDEDPVEAAKVVTEWVEADKDRHFHALVNNAGIGFGGNVDWNDVSTYKLTMEVNCFGMIRMVKAFLSLIKCQVRDSSYNHARIINMVSMAGLVNSVGFSPYTTSKFAAESFSTTLRLELQAIGVRVVTVNPSFHETPLVTTMTDVAIRSWRALPQSLRDEYGEEYFEGNVIEFLKLPMSVMWRSRVVTEQMTRMVELLNPPPQCPVGMDAKFALMVSRMLPVWLQDMIAPNYSVKPAFMEAGTPKEKGD